MKKVAQYNEHFGRVLSDEASAEKEEALAAVPEAVMVVAAADAPEDVKDEADVVADGKDDQEEINAAVEDAAKVEEKDAEGAEAEVSDDAPEAKPAPKKTAKKKK